MLCILLVGYGTGSVEKLFEHIIKTFLFLGVYNVQKCTELNLHRYFLIPAWVLCNINVQLTLCVEFNSASALHTEALAGILLSTL